MSVIASYYCPIKIPILYTSFPPDVAFTVAGEIIGLAPLVSCLSMLLKHLDPNIVHRYDIKVSFIILSP